MNDNAMNNLSAHSNTSQHDIIYDEIAKMLLSCIDDLNNYERCRSIVNKIIKDVAAKYSLHTLPKYSDILSALKNYDLNNDTLARLRRVLLVRPSRSASGVTVISVMPMPYPCPHGRCIYCPGGVEVNIPNSYTESSPATIVAKRYSYDPYMQIRSKLDTLAYNGHCISKVELVIVGGTFLFMPLDYQRWFIRSCYDALNGFRSESLEDAIRANETAAVRNVGFTVETKPDYCKKEHVDLMLSYGITRVEIGVQALRDSVYKLVNRGHTLQDVVEAFQIARDAGYKIVAHMMPGLYGSSLEQDYEDFVKLFNDDRFKPDMIKIYPTLVIKGTPLYELYKRGEYNSYEEEDMIDLIARVKSIVPRWVRIMRIQREIDKDEIVAGVKHGNLRQLVLKRLKEQGLECRCIRCREAGLKLNGKSVDLSNVKLVREDYNASNGKEVFLSYEDKEHDILFGFLRLRKPSSNAHREELRDACIVRELHVYGQVVPLSSRYEWSYQHKGFGRMLMSEAERIAREEFNVSKILVISAVGTREYYRRLGYYKEGPYMAKLL
jgi:elongator complex protein 3